MGKLIVLSGPSCVGKGPLVNALKRFYHEHAAALTPVVLYNDRAPRPGEQDGVDYHFRARDEIESLRKRDGFKVMEVRGDLQAVDVSELRQMLEQGHAFFEGNPFLGTELLDVQPDATVSAFLAPLSRDEIVALKASMQQEGLQKLITDVMRRKLLRRTQRHKGILSLKDLENIERRAGSAYRELQMAHRFDGVIVNHDGEDSENWDAFYHPIGDARKALIAFVSLLEGTGRTGMEHWEKDLLP
jgi:guanylate kinase